MRILIACEYSGVVREAFRRRDLDHTVYSCDILPTDIPGRHYQGDVRDLLSKRWDIIIAFPPCTKLSKVGAAWWPRWREDGSQQEAIDFFMMFAEHRCPRVVIENPAGIMSRMYRKPDQYVQPWWFGDPWIKATGLWLRGVPELEATNVVEPKGHWVDGGTMKVVGSAKGEEGSYVKGWDNAARAHARSKTFQGIADAMASQWG